LKYNIDAFILWHGKKPIKIGPPHSNKKCAIFYRHRPIPKSNIFGPPPSKKQLKNHPSNKKLHKRNPKTNQGHGSKKTSVIRMLMMLKKMNKKSLFPPPPKDKRGLKNDPKSLKTTTR
jgi:hypothetical protein